ncbi:MAG: hypothetical protein GY859_06860, partial [Desulfobacterales bacterium]|nr:hypothetical protein [Desulfobacterales bacterium]
MLIQNVSAENKEICKIVDYHPKFTRRPDLSVQTRTHIAFTAYMAMLSCARAWGTITALANEFGISRTFVYQLASKCGEICTRIFGEREFNALPDGEKKRALSFILSLRLEGRCSIGSTSTILNRFQIKPGSEGAISQYMKHFGQMLPSTL